MDDHFLLSIDHPVLRNHKAYGQELLPGLAYIDLLYQFFRENGHDFSELQLGNVSLYNPLTARPDCPTMLSIQCTEVQEGHWHIVIDGQEQYSNNSPATKKRYLTAEMVRISPLRFAETLDLPRIRQGARKNDLHEMYHRFQQHELVHSGLMKADGTVYDDGAAVVMDIAIGQDAFPSALEVMFHPALIDGSAIGSGELFFSLIEEEGQLFLPLYFEAFYASSLIQRTCITQVQTSSVRRKNELLHGTMEFFDPSGQKIGELKNFTSKLVRAPHLINPARAGNQLYGPRTQRGKEGGLSLGTGTRKGEEEKAAGEAETFLRRLLAARLRQPESQIGIDAGYYEMGLNSPGLLEIVKAIETKISATLPPTLLFEYTTIAQLARYLADNFAACFGGNGVGEADYLPSGSLSGTVRSSLPPSSPPDSGDSHDHVYQERYPGTLPANNTSPTGNDIAVIGMSCRYPGANNIREFWENLRNGVDCIGEIPPSRWDWQQHDDLQSPSGRKMSRWGGFLSNPEYFDPLFFRITPREAEILDPQERLFLEVCWETLEDAGYTPKSLVPPKGRFQRRQVGVFVGVMHKDYSLIGADALTRGQTFPLSLNYASIANRVSYFCNFHGPSMAVDTVCSSSLTALHLALESLATGSSEVAIAGGVNLSLHPAKYLTYGLMDMHSSDGRCRSFGEAGDGYVSGEGVGAVLLKPLHKAIADRDHIYAVIKGSAINHGGAVSGITVPNPVGQADVILACLEKTGIDPRTISYVEAHGTGTSLGDPIEIQGLVKAYRQFTADHQFCAIGSVKSNIGHAEAAAGISGLHKVILQLYHQTLVPSLHSEGLNQYIDFRQSPFHVQQKTEQWPRPIRMMNGRELIRPRRAGLSSFGATGANGHVILEEYPREKILYQPEDVLRSELVIVPLSARNGEQLNSYAIRLLAFLQVATPGEGHGENEKAKDFPGAGKTSVRDLAYTLQVGREELEERVAFLVRDMQELRMKLRAYTQGGSEIPDCWRGSARHDQQALGFLLGDQDYEELLHRWITQNKLKKVAELWVKGFSVDWELLYGPQRPSRLSLPTYPFARERYWVPTPPSPPNTKNGRPLLEAMLAVDPQNRVPRLESYLQEKISQILKLDTSQPLDPQLPLAFLGFDSYMALQLQKHLEEEMHLDFSAIHLLGDENISKLTEMLVPQVVRNEP